MNPRKRIRTGQRHEFARAVCVSGASGSSGASGVPGVSGASVVRLVRPVRVVCPVCPVRLVCPEKGGSLGECSQPVETQYKLCAL